MADMLRFPLVASHPRIATALVVIFFVIAPLGRAADKTLRSDASAKSVGLWVQANQDQFATPILTSEPKVLFYADRIENYQQDRDISDQIKAWQQRNNYQAIEAYARGRKAQTIVILLEDRSLSLETLFSDYKPLRVIPGRKGRYVIFTRADA